MSNLITTLKRLTPRAAFSLLLLTAGCSQDPIFDYISGETAPTNPIIRGSPSKMVRAVIDGREKLYVANGGIWEYDLDPHAPAAFWSSSPGPGGYVADLASVSGASGDVLYALAIGNATAQVWQNNGNGWEELDPPGDYGFIQNIFGAGDALFATGAKADGDAYDYAILYKDSGGFRVVEETAGIPVAGALLTGAGKVGNDYYLAARGKGIYKSSGSGSSLTLALETAAASVPTDVAGLLQAEADVIVGISAGGYLVRVDASGLKVDPTSLGGTYYSGALALMDSPDPQDGYDKLLLLGYKTRSSSYQQGYMELQFKSDGTHDGTPLIPGENQPSSVSDNQQYDSSLRRYPVTALWVLEPAQAGEPSVIFAATTNQGLYSYRNRSDGGWQWNHEE